MDKPDVEMHEYLLVGGTRDGERLATRGLRVIDLLTAGAPVGCERYYLVPMFVGPDRNAAAAVYVHEGLTVAATMQKLIDGYRPVTEGAAG